MQETLIDQGLNLMLFGMGTVFIFLTILVFATTVMSKVVNSIAKEEPAINPTPLPNEPSSSSQPHPNTLRAIEQAIALHRNR